MLTTYDRERYDRQIRIPEIGEEGQAKLKAAAVFIAGAGGLGSPIALYLAAAGVGTLRIVDNDTVTLSNLNRQILHGDDDIGKSKADSAADSLQRLNSMVTLQCLPQTITSANAADLVRGCDLVVDALDNLETRFLLNKVALEFEIPLCHGAVNGFEGRAMTVIPGETACLGCLLHGAPAPGKFPVIGATPAVIGAIQATEAIKAITGAGRLLAGRLLRYDGLSLDFSEFKINKNPQCKYCGGE
ncbi:MAG: HesA/MoeB/ThiF family protein [Desulfobacterales bacterium]|nr:HesA/MoeB/ThiF family protein [Desulfobacterales bacterium]